MTDQIDIHPANREELLAAHANVHDVWSQGLAMAAHIERRLTSPHHQRANWFVGTLEGRVVTSLAAHPFEFRIDGLLEPGIGIASVHTLAEFRGRGLAPRLLGWVERWARQRGAAVSLLYSDVAPSYYARLGYTECPAWQGEHRATAPLAGDLTVNWRLRPLQPVAWRGALAGLYGSCHGRDGVSFERSAEYWDYLFARGTEDHYFLLEPASGAAQGYARVAVRDGVWRLVDWAVADRAPHLLAVLCVLVAELAAAQGSAVSGWLPAWPELARYFKFMPRQDEISMLKWLAPGRAFSADQIASAAAFCEIDHV